MKKQKQKNSKKLVALGLTDLHINPKNLEVVSKVWMEAVDYCVRKQIGTILFLGDMFTERAKQSLDCLLCFQNMLKYAELNRIMVVGIHGNHDQTDQNSIHSYMSLFSSKFYVLANGPHVIRLMDNLVVHLMPFFKDNALYLKGIGDLKLMYNYRQGDTTILLTHKDFNGVRNNDGSVVKDGIDPEAVAHYDRVLVGHYHDRSRVGTNIRYVGAAIQHNFGEYWEKGFFILHEDGSIGYKNATFPRYMKHKVFVADHEAALQQITEIIDEVMEGDYVRIILVGSTVDIDKMPVTLMREAGIDVKFERDDMLSTDFDSIDSYQVMMFNKASILKAYLEYAQLQNFTPGQRTSGLLYLKDSKADDNVVTS